jgi:hypothetical protein
MHAPYVATDFRKMQDPLKLFHTPHRKALLNLASKDLTLRAISYMSRQLKTTTKVDDLTFVETVLCKKGHLGVCLLWLKHMRSLDGTTVKTCLGPWCNV